MVANAYYEFEKYENPSLPSHWVKKKGKYRPYYVNTSINVTTWFHPGTLMQPLLDLIGQDKVKKNCRSSPEEERTPFPARNNNIKLL